MCSDRRPRLSAERSSGNVGTKSEAGAFASASGFRGQCCEAGHGLEDENKKAMRKRLAALSFSEKIKSLEKLRDRDRAILASGLRKTERVTPKEAIGDEIGVALKYIERKK